MAGCCPDTPPSNAIGAAAFEAGGPESDIRRGETVECYMARGGNTTGRHDDATANVINKIDNTSIPIIRTATSASVDMQFKLTSGSTRAPTTWSIDNLPPGLTLSPSGHLSGTFSTLGTKYQVKVTASDAAGEIDVRGFTVAPSVGSERSQIQLISPLPGAIVNSKFGPRMHPIHNVMKPHTGIDMKYADRSVKDCVAAADGTVILAGGNPSSGYGIRVWIKHETASGNHLCTTTYNHLNKVYVRVGQKVMAGQKVGLEGTTGSSTGNHLHFECKLPDGKFIDPEPLIRGSLSVAQETLANGDPAQVVTRQSTGAALAEAEVQARQDSCESFGPSYPEPSPGSPQETNDPIPSGSPTDPFELAWFFTMKHEVGPHWSIPAGSMPSDPDIANGLVQTSAQRRKCGYVNLPNFPGGETKFGIAQDPNPSLKVRTATYEDCKRVGYNNYWKGSLIPSTGPLLANAPLVSIMMFDINFLHGQGNARKIWQSAGLDITGPKTHAEQKTLCAELTEVRLAFIRQIKDLSRFPGWITRAKANLTYVNSLPPLGPS